MILFAYLVKRQAQLFIVCLFLLVFLERCLLVGQIDREIDRYIQYTEHTYIHRQLLQHLYFSFDYLFLKKTHTQKHSLQCSHVYIRYSTAANSVWKVCPDDMMICSRKLMKLRAPEVPEPQRLLCRQPKAYLQAATSHSSICLGLVNIIVSSVTLGTETSKCWDSQRSTAFSSTKPEHIALHYWEYETVLYLLEVCVQ